MFIILYTILQWTWGIVQNIIGAFIFLAFINKEHYFYRGAVVTRWRERGPGLGMGMFIFVSGSEKRPESRGVLVHEYGHTIQSALLGPLYLLLIGLPSFCWCASKKLEQYRKKNNVSYYSFYPEKWANYLGEHFTGEESAR